jgi:hypothetical protein
MKAAMTRAVSDKPSYGARPSRRVWLLLLLLAISSPTRGQIGSVGPAADPTGSQPRTIGGTVVNSVTGEPIYRALVQLGGEYAMLTDHEGHFEFDGVTASGIPPWAMKPGYFAEERFQQMSASALAASFSAQSVIKLVPEAILSGTVTGQDGAPLEGIRVQLKTLAVEDGLSRWRQRQSTTTNSDGQYRFAELQAGRYAVTTGFHPEGLAGAQGTLAYVPARYPSPSAGAPAADAAIVLKPGDHSVADLSPEVEKLYPVTGTIAGYGENRGVGFRVETPSGEEITPLARFTARTGEFRLMLPGGTYQVTATAYGRQGALEARREVTVPHAPVGGIALTMSPYAAIPVEFEIDAVSQAAEGAATGSPGTPMSAVSANISLTSANGEGFTPYLSAQPLRGDDPSGGGSGPLVIQNVAPGRYVLQAQPQAPWYVASASCGGVNLLHEELTVGSGSTACSMRVVLRNDSGSARVTVRDGDQDPAANGSRAYYVYALPLGNLAQRMIRLNQQNNDFSADGLAPGRYLVLALDHHEELPYRDPEAMRKYAGLGQEIAVAANGTANAEVAPIAGKP